MYCIWWLRYRCNHQAKEGFSMIEKNEYRARFSISTMIIFISAYLDLEVGCFEHEGAGRFLFLLFCCSFFEAVLQAVLAKDLKLKIVLKINFDVHQTSCHRSCPFPLWYLPLEPCAEWTGSIWWKLNLFFKIFLRFPWPMMKAVPSLPSIACSALPVCQVSRPSPSFRRFQCPEQIGPNCRAQPVPNISHKCATQDPEII